jgi:NAD(P)H dehydrogenase (quinone)
VIAPLSPGFNLDRYDRELRRPFPSEPQFAPESKVWRREHAIAHAERGALNPRLRTQRA